MRIQDDFPSARSPLGDPPRRFRFHSVCFVLSKMTSTEKSAWRYTRGNDARKKIVLKATRVLLCSYFALRTLRPNNDNQETNKARMVHWSEIKKFLLLPVDQSLDDLGSLLFYEIRERCWFVCYFWFLSFLYYFSSSGERCLYRVIRIVSYN